MTARNFGLSSRYDYKRSDFHVARTQREAGIDHLEWDRPLLAPVVWIYGATAVLCFALGGALAWFTP